MPLKSANQRLASSGGFEWRENRGGLAAVSQALIGRFEKACIP